MFILSTKKALPIESMSWIQKKARVLYFLSWTKPFLEMAKEFGFGPLPQVKEPCLPYQFWKVESKPFPFFHLPSAFVYLIKTEP